MGRTSRTDVTVGYLVVFEGHLTRAKVDAAFEELTPRLGSTPRPLVVDCIAMKGYDLDARDGFVAWNRAHAGRVSAVAIATANPLHRLVIATMRLATKQNMQAFATREEAELWAARESSARP